MAIQNTLSPEQSTIGMSLVVFSQTFGGSLFLTFAENIFNHGVASGLERFAPTVDPQTVLRAGASAVREILDANKISGVLEAYNLAINHTFYLAAGAAAGTFAFCWGMGWRKVSKKEIVTAEV